MNPLTITAETFQQEVLDSDLPVLLDFWAPWCGPCRAVAPVLDRIAEEYDGRLKVGKVNVDEQPQLAGAFGIRGIPTLVVMQGATPTVAMSGAGSKEAVVRGLRLDELPAAA